MTTYVCKTCQQRMEQSVHWEMRSTASQSFQRLSAPYRCANPDCLMHRQPRLGGWYDVID